MTATITEPLIESRAKRLKALTSDVHEGVDRSIMSAASFASIERYKQFLAIQFLFHRDVAALYAEPRLQAAFPDLAQRCRLPLVVADMEDLSITAPDGGSPAFVPDTEFALGTALGWLYVAEGSNMGAALLRKEAQKLGLTDDLGARHLAPAPEGPAPHWRAFVAALDAVALTDDEEKRAEDGARNAFALSMRVLAEASQAGLLQRGRAARAGWLVLGVMLVAIGFVGIFVPLLPTMDFLLLALPCFARSSPRLEAWLLNHPRYGPSLRAWRTDRAVPRHAKIAACIGMALGYGLFWFHLRPGIFLSCAVVAFMLFWAIWIVRRPEPGVLR